MTRILNNRRRRPLIWLAYLGLACRAVVPAGYMPASIGDGGPVILCPGGLAGQFFVQPGAAHGTHANGHHGVGAAVSTPHDNAGDVHDGHTGAWELCPIGASLGGAALTAEFDVAVLDLVAAAPSAELEFRPATRFLSLYRARAPPRIHSPIV